MVCKIERGDHLPQAKTAEEIECALGLPPLTLVGFRNQIAQDACHDDNPAFDDPNCRFAPACDKHSIEDGEYAKMAEAVAGVADQYATALGALGKATFCRINLGAQPMSNAQDGIARAEELRDVLGDSTTSLPALLPFLEQRNFRFIPLPSLPPVRHGAKTSQRVAFAMHDQRHDNPVIVVNEQAPVHSQTYHIAYEIGSYMRYRRRQMLSRLSKHDESVFCRPFASTLLIPRPVIVDIVADLNVRPHEWTVPLVDNVAYRFGVSSSVLVWRLQSLRLIDDALGERFKAALRQPHACDDPESFPPRPPIVYGTWLKTLRRRVADCDAGSRAHRCSRGVRP